MCLRLRHMKKRMLLLLTAHDRGGCFNECHLLKSPQQCKIQYYTFAPSLFFLPTLFFPLMPISLLPSLWCHASLKCRKKESTIVLGAFLCWQSREAPADLYTQLLVMSFSLLSLRFAPLFTQYSMWGDLNLQRVIRQNRGIKRLY